jgi:hypothetical protein
MTGVPEDLYETDYYRWVKTQVAELRRMRRDRVNTALDLERLADEVSDLGKSQRNACRSALLVVLEHLLKLEYSPADLPRADWRASVRRARRALADRLTPSIRNDLARHLEDLYTDARVIAADALREHDEIAAADSLPPSCPYPLTRLLDRDWLPPKPSASGSAPRPGSRRSRA